MTGVRRPMVGVSLKMYFSPTETRAWLEGVARLARETGVTGRLDLLVAPDFLALCEARAILAGTGVLLGAQDVFWEDRGPFTGEVSAPSLREIGCAYVEVGHAERRELFGEDDEVAARKALAVVHAGMSPLVCVGEVVRDEVDAAVAVTVTQIDRVLGALPGCAELVFAYEPVWAIGANRPAEPSRIIQVVDQLQARLRQHPSSPRLIYGGSAGPGLYPRLASHVDGLFLGRFAHAIENLASVLAEVGATRAPVLGEVTPSASA